MPADHYYSDDPQSPSEPREITATLRGEAWRFMTDHGVFSPDRVDPGSRLLIEAMEIATGASVLDVGAGYGPMGLVAARLAGPTGTITLCEVNRRAAELARQNALLNGLHNVTVIETAAPVVPELPPQDVVLTNPPIRAGWKVVMPLLEAAAGALRPGGALWLVGYKHLGVKTLEKRLVELLGAAECIDKSGGYRVLRSIREVSDG